MASYRFAFAVLLGSQAAAFSFIGVKTSRANQRLYYKDPNEDYGYHKVPTNGTVVFNDFEVRESESVPSGDADVLPSAVEPGDKPASKFVSPIEMIKLVPKVTPIANSSIFYVAPVLERPAAAPQETEATTVIDPIVEDSPKMKPKWSPRSTFGSNAFQSSGYLDSLSPSSASDEDLENRSLQSSLRNKQRNIREDKLRTAQQAMQEATRRTNPAEVIQARIEKAEEIRKQREVEHLEKQMLNEKQRLKKEGSMTMERYLEERRRLDAAVESDAGEMQSIPILDPFQEQSQSTPLLIGATIMLKYEDMKETLEMAQSLQQEQMKVDIDAAPVVAIIDQYTGNMSSEKRFATLASIEIVKDESGEPASVNLMGVGRVFLHTKDEELTKDHGDKASVQVAGFEHFLDGSSFVAESSRQQDAIDQQTDTTELYRAANKVYRLHEERKNILSGLRAGQARLKNADAIEDYGFATYGMLSTIPDLTNDLLPRLQPYHSDSYRDREQYEAEVASFVCLRVLESYACPTELAAAMMAPSATERLYMAYAIMSRHKNELLALVTKMNDDLTGCGEEG